MILALAAAVALGAGGGDVAEDAPTASQPASGDVTGTITPAEKVAAVSAVSRATGQQYKPSSWDAKTGKFLFARLPGDAAYDICVRTTDGARIEGIDLSWHEARMLRLAALRRDQLKLPAERPRQFVQEDADALLKYAKDLTDFTDFRRVLYIAGDGLRATALVEAMRTREFHARRGDQVVWRVELWYFDFRHGGWERAANVERVLERNRIPYQQWGKITLVFYPELSAYVDEKGLSKPVHFTIPAKLDPARGRLAGSEPEIKTQRFIVGLGGRAPATASAPAGE